MKKLLFIISILTVNIIFSEQEESLLLDQSNQSTREIDCLFATQINHFTLNITQPGAYCLIEDFEVPQGRVAGFVITSDDVLLDLNGHILTGAGSATSIGIIIRPATTIAPRNITIRNGTLAFMRSSGISINTASNVIIDDIVFLADATGIIANNVIRSIISNCTFTLSTNSGVVFNNIPGVTSQTVSILNCASYNNIVNGFSLNNCSNFIIHSTIANNNGANGFLENAGNQSDYRDCIANSNLGIGFAIGGVSDSIEQCQAKGNGTVGFLLAANSAQAQVRDNIATGNGVGFQNAGNANNRFYANFANNNKTNFVNIPNFFVSPVPATPINFTTNIAN